MAEVLVATESGCVVYRNGGTPELELPGREVGYLASGQDGGCIAVVDQREVWQRSPERVWSKLAIADIPLQSVLAIGDNVFAGGMNEATVLRMTRDGGMSILNGFEDVPGRSQWFAGGPPLGVRSLAATCDAETLIAAVHVGGMPRSEDGGNTWKPTIPVMFDVHEVRTHPSLPNFVAAAAAVGLCVSFDRGKTWEVIAEGLEITNSLAVAVLETEVLFSVQDGPFAKRSPSPRETELLPCLRTSPLPIENRRSDLFLHLPDETWQESAGFRVLPSLAGSLFPPALSPDASN